MWEKIYINAQNIKHATESAYLIQMPRKSDYAGYSFWHPAKLVRSEGGNGYYVSVSFTEKFIFNLKKFGKGKYNKYDIIHEFSINAEEFSEQFNENIKKEVERENYINKDSYLEIKEPEKVIDDEVRIKEELLND